MYSVEIEEDRVLIRSDKTRKIVAEFSDHEGVSLKQLELIAQSVVVGLNFMRMRGRQ